MYRSTFILLAFIAACAYGSAILPRDLPISDGRIVGGEDTTIENFPYQVSVRLYDRHICGGSIYSSRAIVTAAHCLDNFYIYLGVGYYSIQYGTTVIGGMDNVIQAEYFDIYGGFNPITLDNDVAVIFLVSDIPFGASAQPIPLATQTPAAGTNAVVSGWGTLTENGDSASILQKVDVEVVEKSVCREQYAGRYDITYMMICAAVDEGGKDACQGDSGGPLVANGELIGLVSFGIGCARREFSGVYGNIAYMRYWIDGVIREYHA